MAEHSSVYIPTHGATLLLFPLFSTLTSISLDTLNMPLFSHLSWTLQHSVLLYSGLEYAYYPPLSPIPFTWLTSHRWEVSIDATSFRKLILSHSVWVWCRSYLRGCSQVCLSQVTVNSLRGVTLFHHWITRIWHNIWNICCSALNCWVKVQRSFCECYTLHLWAVSKRNCKQQYFIKKNLTIYLTTCVELGSPRLLSVPQWCQDLSSFILFSVHYH